MRYLYFDVFKDGRSVEEMPPDILKLENKFAFQSGITDQSHRFSLIINYTRNTIHGAVVHLSGLDSLAAAEQFTTKIPWISHGLADGSILPIENFNSIQKLFNQNGKYKDRSPVVRLKPFNGDPTEVWYAIIVAKDPAAYERQFEEGDAFATFRLLKGHIIDEAMDLREGKKRQGPKDQGQ